MTSAGLTLRISLDAFPFPFLCHLSPPIHKGDVEAVAQNKLDYYVMDTIVGRRAPKRAPFMRWKRTGPEREGREGRWGFNPLGCFLVNLILGLIITNLVLTLLTVKSRLSLCLPSPQGQKDMLLIGMPYDGSTHCRPSYESRDGKSGLGKGSGERSAG